jgi:hypothetical protein
MEVAQRDDRHQSRSATSLISNAEISFKIPLRVAPWESKRAEFCWSTCVASCGTGCTKYFLNEMFVGCRICETEERIIEEFLKANIYHSRRTNGRNPCEKWEGNSH